MYFDQIKAELVEAQDVLNKFVSDDNNIKLIEKAAKLLAESFKNGGKVLSCGKCTWIDSMGNKIWGN